MTIKTIVPRVRVRNTAKDAPEFRASHKYAKGSPQKARLIMDQIRGLEVSAALSLLQHSTRRAARQIEKVLKSAISNADYAIENELVRDSQGVVIEPQPNTDVEDLYIHECTATDGPRLKRWRPRARGSAFPYRKYTCHLSIKLRPMPGQDS
ncbi:MAG TPA: 50S ribosomal protein L22 [Planctomycetes bacterium]|nr:50S ribosomal protein L22 [Planctomycetota bacterium]